MTKEERLLAIKEKLKARAKKLHPDDSEAQNRYVFGTLHNIKERMKRA